MKKSKTNNQTEKDMNVKAEIDQIMGQIEEIEIFRSIEDRNAQI
jgi:hypothetical protein